MNSKNAHFFYKGMQADFDDHLKDKETYTLGVNGRVFMKNGQLAFTSVKGTTEIYNNPNIAKYLGTFVFKDVVVVFAKCSGYPINNSGVIFETEEIDVVIAQNFDIELLGGSLLFGTQFTDNAVETTYTQNTSVPAPPTEIDFDNNYSPEGASVETIGLDTYYKLDVNVPVFGSCPADANIVPPNNADYSDCILTLRYDDNDVLYETIAWSGYQNWSFDSKIIALGVEENSNYMRVKYTDNINPFRSINLYDSQLFRRSAQELNNFQSTILLQPRIAAIETLGQLKTMSAQYYYRLITENGQVTEFSPASDMVFITPTDLVAFTGGGIGEFTNKSVKVVCNVVDSRNFNEIELIAAEYEADAGVPTSIKSLGIQNVGEVNTFYHYGSEANFSTDVTLADLIASQINWRYCSDLASKNNKLFASGLRNDPLSSEFNSLKYNFALHGWKANGETHSSFLNPDPILYNKIPVGYVQDFFYVKKRIFKAIKIFQNANVTFGPYTLAINNSSNFYTDQTEEIASWLLDLQTNDAGFAAAFPNLLIELISGTILFKPIDALLETDFTPYRFDYDTDQVIEDKEDEVIFDDTPITGFPMVDGAMSPGYNSGNGIRISFNLVREELATKATGRYTGSGKVVDFKEPTFKRTFIKDEIYRLGVHMYRNGEQLFVIPLGDLKIPGLGASYSYIDPVTGNAVFSTSKYVNQVLDGNKMYGMRVELRCDVRLDCEYSKDIDMYRIMYVERTENNRTVLAQGMAAPLMRVQDPVQFLRTSFWTFNEKLRDKWMLPYYGGPTYDKLGLEAFDADGDIGLDTYDWTKRVSHDRSMMYLDCPDIIYGNTSDNLISSCKLHVVGKLNTDETGAVIMESGELTTTNTGPKQDMAAQFGTEVYPKFSRKITSQYIKSIDGVKEDLPWHSRDEDIDNTVQTHFVNVSVFANFTPFSSQHDIEGAVTLLPGQVIPGTELNTTFDLSNNAMCLPSMPWWFASTVRRIDKQDDENQYQAMLASRPSEGQKTIFVKSTTDIFTNNFIGPVTLPRPDSQIARENAKNIDIYDTHALINLKRSNEVSIYGGRTELAFTKNEYIPLSETIPVNKSTNGAQTSFVQGDGYVTLYLRTKNIKGDENEFLEDGEGPIGKKLNNGRGGAGAQNRHDIENVYVLHGAWCYGVVLETMIEPKLNHEYEFYRENTNIDFYQIKNEVLNSAYEVRNNSKRFRPQPFRFKDDPLLTNIVAASEVKLSGDYYDAWSSFLVNEFQELDKDKGACFNLVKWKNEIFAIQEIQTNQLNIDRDTMIPTEDGTALNIKQGAGKSIDGYQVISPYGTSIRRSVAKHDVYGFSFIDETQNVLIKVDTPININNQYHFNFFNSLKNDPVMDVEAFFDVEHQESGWQIKQKSGITRALTYGEKTGVLNGFYDYNSSLYFSFKEKLFAPIHTVTGAVHESASLQLLNSGVPLQYFNSQFDMSISFVSPSGVDNVAIYNHITMVVGSMTTISKIEFTTKQGITRTILSDHRSYKVREGIHSVPLLNYWFEGIEREEENPLRTEYVKITIFFPYTGFKQKIISAIIDIRKSYI